MRDYAELIKRLRSPVMWDDGEDCVACEMLQDDAAAAIEELQDQIADVSKMICDLIACAQKNADESREAEQRHYGSDSTVNVYTWMHNVKRVHERYVAMLDDIAAKLPAPPKKDRNKRFSDDEISDRMRRRDEEMLMVMKREEERRERDREIREECRKGWWK